MFIRFCSWYLPDGSTTSLHWGFHSLNTCWSVFCCCLLTGLFLAEMTESQQQVQGLNRQYDQVGESLSDQQRELQFMMHGVTSFNEDFERLLLWLHCTEQQLNESGQNDDETQRVWKLFCRCCVIHCPCFRTCHTWYYLATHSGRVWW